MKVATIKPDYRETIKQKIEGVGMYAPSGHFAEVHLLLEPGPKASGLTFENHLAPKVLDRKWQKQIMQALKTIDHRGVLTGAPITDIKISLIGGSQQQKYSHGHDFFEAAKRAVRQGLMKLKQQDAVELLSSWNVGQITISSRDYGQFVALVGQLQGKILKVITEFENTVSLEIELSTKNFLYLQKHTLLKNNHYHLTYLRTNYYPCKNPASIIEQIAYDALQDKLNSPNAVACHHASDQLIVPWNQVEQIAFYPVSKFS